MSGINVCAFDLHEQTFTAFQKISCTKLNTSFAICFLILKDVQLTLTAILIKF